MSEKKYSIAVDFDGVIHSYTTPWVSADHIPDPPVPGAIEWLKDMQRHFKVIIFTTRAGYDMGPAAIRGWLDRNGWGAERAWPEITAIKPPCLVYIDDRAWRFEGRFPTAQEIHEARPWNKQEINKP